MWRVIFSLVGLVHLCFSASLIDYRPSGFHDRSDPQLSADDNTHTVITVNNECSDQKWQAMKAELKEVITASIPDNTGEKLRLNNLGKEWKYAAYSCKEIAEKTQFTSGYYWMKPSDEVEPQPVFCELDELFDIGERGWLRIANWNMTEQSQCPKAYGNGKFKLITSPQRLCGKSNVYSGCSTARFSGFGYRYNRVCGRIIGWKHNTPDGFKNVVCGARCTIDDTYLDGVSITYGFTDKTHVWSFAAHECSQPGYTPPTFVGNNYFCDSSNQLWSDKTFCTEMPFHGAGNINVRVCTDHEDNEDVQIQLIELYVQ